MIAAVLQVPGISSIHELHIWRLSPQKTLATVHIVFNSKQNILTRYDDINFIFRTLQIDHVTIQPEFALVSCARLSGPTDSSNRSRQALN